MVAAYEHQMCEVLDVLSHGQSYRHGGDLFCFLQNESESEVRTSGHLLDIHGTQGQTQLMAGSTSTAPFKMKMHQVLIPTVPSTVYDFQIARNSEREFGISYFQFH